MSTKSNAGPLSSSRPELARSSPASARRPFRSICGGEKEKYGTGECVHCRDYRTRSRFPIPTPLYSRLGHATPWTPQGKSRTPNCDEGCVQDTTDTAGKGDRGEGEEGPPHNKWDILRDCDTSQRGDCKTSNKGGLGAHCIVLVCNVIELLLTDLKHQSDRPILESDILGRKHRGVEVAGCLSEDINGEEEPQEFFGRIRPNGGLGSTACSHLTNKEREAMARESAGAPALDLENYKKFYGFGIPK